MSNPIGDAVAVNSLARLYEHAVEEITVAGTETVNALLKAEFECPDATRLANTAADRRANCGTYAEEMQNMARALRLHADWIEETTAEMNRLEQRIRAWAAANPAGTDVLTGQPTASLITYYPESGSLEWEDVAARLRANGATF